MVPDLEDGLVLGPANGLTRLGDTLTYGLSVPPYFGKLGKPTKQA